MVEFWGVPRKSTCIIGNKFAGKEKTTAVRTRAKVVLMEFGIRLCTIPSHRGQ